MLIRDRPAGKYHEIDLLISSATAALSAPTGSEPHVSEDVIREEVTRLCRLVDWDVVTRLAGRHEIAPLVWSYWQAHCADHIPAEVRARFRLDSGLARMRGKKLTAAMLEVLQAFRAEGIRGVPFKGVVLAEQAFGPGMPRICEDIDLIVQLEDVPRADGIMRELGYGPGGPQLPSSELDEFLASEYHLSYMRKDGIAFEVHWNLGHDVFCGSLDVRRLLERAGTVCFAGAEIPAFTPEDLVVILSIHGAKHGWERLKWVFDLAGLLRRHPDLDVEAVDRLAQAFGCRRMVALGLQLAAGAIQANSASRFASRPLAALREQWSMAEVPTLSLVDVQVRTRDTRLERWRLVWWRIVRRIKPNERDRAVVALPRALHGLYYVIRPYRLLTQYGRKF
jgi:hypothetical protein